MKIKYFFIILLLTNLFSACYKNEELREGDILFQDIDCGLVCDAIEKVTDGYKAYNISHCGIVVREGKDLYVIEAYGDVKKTPLKKFLSRAKDENGNPKVIAGRLKPEYRKYIPLAIIKAFALIGKQYDRVFEIDNDKYYCSELIYEIFNNKHQEKIFELRKMTYINPKTNEIEEFWSEYFSQLNIKIPEGELGCNPADYSRSEKIEIFREFGELSKKDY